MGKLFILADNQDVTREGIAAIIAATYPDAVFTVAASRKELQTALASAPDATVVLDYTLFDFTSMEQMLHVKEAAGASSWVLFSDELSASFLRHVLVASPDMSVVMKYDARAQIERALREVVAGRSFRCDFALQALRSGPSDDSHSDRLTATEKIVLREIALGKTTREIAAEKNLSFHTINAHRRNIFRKLDINSVHEAIRHALRAGIIDMSDYTI